MSSERQIGSFSVNDVKEVEPSTYSYYLWSCMFKQFCCFGLQRYRSYHYLQCLICSSAIRKRPLIQTLNIIYLFIPTPHSISILSVLWRQTFHQKENCFFTPFAFLQKETEMNPSWRKALLRG